MILNTGARTDTAQYFSDWLLKRFEEGFVYTRNPLFPDKVTRYELSPDKIDAVLFCSKNYAPILPRIQEITSKYRTYFHYTITAYGKDVETGVPSIEESVKTLAELSKIAGKEKSPGDTIRFFLRKNIRLKSILKLSDGSAESLHLTLTAVFSVLLKSTRSFRLTCRN